VSIYNEDKTKEAGVFFTGFFLSEKSSTTFVMLDLFCS